MIWCPLPAILVGIQHLLVLNTFVDQRLCNMPLTAAPTPTSTSSSLLSLLLSLLLLLLLLLSCACAKAAAAAPVPTLDVTGCWFHLEKSW